MQSCIFTYWLLEFGNPNFIWSDLKSSWYDIWPNPSTITIDLIGSTGFTPIIWTCLITLAYIYIYIYFHCNCSFDVMDFLLLCLGLRFFYVNLYIYIYCLFSLLCNIFGHIFFLCDSQFSHFNHIIQIFITCFISCLSFLS